MTGKRNRLSEGDMYPLIGYQLTRANFLATRYFTKLVYEHDQLRPVEFTILQLLRSNANVSPTQLAKELGMTTPSMTVILDKLQDRGLLVRQKSATDGRSTSLSLTKDGTKIVEAALDKLLEGDNELLANLSSGERSILIELLHKIWQGSK
jgi:DNA-binding MarR family transcriptional regulator